MYCVKCGVKLQDGVSACPLCDTPVWNPTQEGVKKGEERTYPDNPPRHYRESRLPFVIAATVLTVLVITVQQSILYVLFHNHELSSLVSFGILLAYVVLVLPLWFEHPALEVFSVVDHFALGLFVLYVCNWTGGHWFWKFALPLVVMSCVLVTYLICLLKYVKKGRLFIFGGFLILLGICLTLVEFFQHLYFGSQMFLWSPSYLIGLGVAGLLLIVVGLIRPLRDSLEKHFFF